MRKINLNTLASIVTIKEGKEVSTNVAQVKEVMSVLFKELRTYSDDQIIEAIRRN